MEDNEDLFEKAYNEYRMLPLNEKSDELYKNYWYIDDYILNIHRYYNFKEFMHKIGCDKTFANRFIFNRFSKN